MNDAPAPPVIERVLSKLDGVKSAGPGKWMARCPVHDDRKASLGVDLGRNGGAVVCCHTGICKTEDVMAAIGLSMADLMPEDGRRARTPARGQKPAAAPRPVRGLYRRAPGGDWGEPVASYHYADADGNPRLHVHRWERITPEGEREKDFQQTHSAAGGEFWGKGSGPMPLYHLPEVLAAVKAGRTVYLVEGEKDADNLRTLGMAATCNPMGAGKWWPELTEYLRGADVVILPDNDDPGRLHAENVARKIQGAAASVRVVSLPGVPEKGDVSDWLAAGGTKEEMERLATEAAEWEPDPAAVVGEEEDAALPVIETNARHLRDVSDEALQAIREANHPPRVFVRDRRLVRVGADTKGRPAIETLTEPALCGHLARVANFVSTSEKRGTIPVAPGEKVVKDILSLPAWPGIPTLDAIVTAPIVAPDGTLVTEPGYHQAARVFYHDAEGLHLPDTTPTPANVQKAKALLLDTLLGDFPFVRDGAPVGDDPEDERRASASRAHALALLLLPFVRQMIKGPIPLNLIDAPTPGSGKTLLVEVTTGIFTPGGATIATAPTEEEEWHKRITSALSNGPAFVFFDNIKRRLSSASLAAALTATEWEDRLFGRNDTLVRLPIRCVWVGTANNVEMEDEQVRRTIWMRLDSKQERPEEREGFKIPNIREWTRQNRPQLVAAALTLVRAWLDEGRPPWKGKLLGSYESWCLVMGGILDTIGVPGFLENRAELYERLDPEREKWAGFFEAWHAAHGEAPVKVADVLELAVNAEIVYTGDSAAKVFGRLLRTQVDRVFGDLRLETAGTVSRVARYRVRKSVSSVSNVSTSSVRGFVSRDEEDNIKPFTGESDTQNTLDTHSAVVDSDGIIWEDTEEGTP